MPEAPQKLLAKLDLADQKINITEATAERLSEHLRRIDKYGEAHNAHGKERYKEAILAAHSKVENNFPQIINLLNSDKPVNSIDAIAKLTDGRRQGLTDPEAANLYRTEVLARLNAELQSSNIEADLAAEIILASLAAWVDRSSPQQALYDAMRAIQQADLPVSLKRTFLPKRQRNELAGEMASSRTTAEIDHTGQVTINGQTFQVTECLILAGASMVNFNHLAGFQLKNIVFRDGVYLAQMQNGCEGNLIVLKTEKVAVREKSETTFQQERSPEKAAAVGEKSETILQQKESPEKAAAAVGEKSETTSQQEESPEKIETQPQPSTEDILNCLAFLEHQEHEAQRAKLSWWRRQFSATLPDIRHRFVAEQKSRGTEDYPFQPEYNGLYPEKEFDPKFYFAELNDLLPVITAIEKKLETLNSQYGEDFAAAKKAFIEQYDSEVIQSALTERLANIDSLPELNELDCDEKVKAALAALNASNEKVAAFFFLFMGSSIILPAIVGGGGGGGGVVEKIGGVGTGGASGVGPL